MRLFALAMFVFLALSRVPASAQDASANPSLDCTKARSTVSKILCSDRAAADADWQLNTAIWALYFSIDDEARKELDREQNAWRSSLELRCRIPTEGMSVARASVSCLVTAYHRQAELYRSRLRGDALAEANSSLEERKTIQQLLAQRHLLFDSVDGQFGQNTRHAIRQFQTLMGATPTGFLSVEQKRQLASASPAMPTFANVLGHLLGVPPMRQDLRQNADLPKPGPSPEKPIVISEAAVSPLTTPAKPREQLSLPFDPAGAPGKRIALVIGNSNYSKVPALSNPRRDADEMGRLFKEAGFAVKVLHDLTNIQMRREINDFSDDASDADIAVVFSQGTESRLMASIISYRSTPQLLVTSMFKTRL